jgi:hypothetical protein
VSDNFCDPNLETEIQVSNILKGLLSNPTYISFREEICKLKMIDVSDDITEVLLMLQRKIVDSMGLLKDNKMEAYYKGKDNELFLLFKQLKEKIGKQIVTYEDALQKRMDESVAELEYSMNQSDYASMVEGLGSISNEEMYTKELEATQQDMFNMEVSLRNIINAYDKNEPFISKKAYYSKFDTEYKLYLDQLTKSIDQITNSALVSMNVFQAIDSITQKVPPNDLDPFKQDEVDNLVHIFMNPKDYYSMCKSEAIDSEENATLFQHVYPEFHKLFLDMYMDDFETMDIQEQTNFRKCFAIPEDNMELVTLCSGYIQLGYMQQQQS